MVSRRKLLANAGAMAAVAALPVAAVASEGWPGVIDGAGGDINAAVAALPDGWTLRSTLDVKWWADGGLKIENKRGISIIGANVETRGAAKSHVSMEGCHSVTVMYCTFTKVGPWAA